MRGRGGSSCRFCCLHFFSLWAMQRRWSTCSTAQKMCIRYIYFADSMHKSMTDKHLYLCIFLVRHSVFCHTSSHTSDPKTHHPVMDSLVLSLRCAKATAVFVPSKDCDIVVEVSKCGSRGLHRFFPCCVSSNNFTAVRAGTSASTSRGLKKLFWGSCSQKQAYGTRLYVT